MASFNIIAQNGTSNASASLNSTKVKVLSNVAVYYAVGSAPVAYNTGNCAMIPANTLRDINCGPGTLVYDATTNVGNVVVGGSGPKIAFLTTGGTALIELTEVGFVDFTKVTN